MMLKSKICATIHSTEEWFSKGVPDGWPIEIATSNFPLTKV